MIDQLSKATSLSINEKDIHNSVILNNYLDQFENFNTLHQIVNHTQLINKYLDFKVTNSKKRHFKQASASFND